MGNYEQLKQAVSDVIKKNGNQEITGEIMQNTLLSIISTVGSNATFVGIATPTTNPGTPDQNVFYIASEPGIYANFGNVKLIDKVLIFSNNNGTWYKSEVNIPNDYSLNRFEVNTFTNNLTINSFIKEIYLSGNGFDKNNKYAIYSIVRGFDGIGWAISIKNIDTGLSTGWIIISDSEELTGYVKAIKGGYTLELLINNWDKIEKQIVFTEEDGKLYNALNIDFSPTIKLINYENETTIQISDIKGYSEENREVLSKQFNLFDFGENGKFIGSNGNISNGEYYKISKFQKVKQGDVVLFTAKYHTTSVLNALYGYNNEQRENPIVLLDWSGEAEYINKEVVIPSGVNYIQGWNDMRKNENPILIFKNKQYTFNEDILNRVLELEKKSPNHKALIVDKNGLGDFTSVVDAVKSINDSSETNVYDIYINEGEYNIIEEYFGEEDYTDANDKGLSLPDYVNLIGLGDRDKVILKGEMPDSIKYRTSQAFSTLNVKYNNNIYNMTITAYNCRYPMHDQTSNSSENCVRYIKNCIFIHKGYNGTPYTGVVDEEHNTTEYRWGSPHAYGQGTNNGSYCEFEYSMFDAQGNTGSAFLTHDNKDAVKGTEIKISHCQFNNKGTSDLINISALGAKICNISFVGNKFGGNKTIKCVCPTTYNPQENFNYILYGNGNSDVIVQMPSGEEAKNNIIQ
jgi:hypothetical protein